ncbi:ABC transporter permease [Enemella dayhoffiae]|uniref:ABC transporter permease n=1 Tax=Enemella dayhoffiae TaxID=2016507 RepID=A0A255HB93_9ACTN|nr:amino acid ABC transporter permease [Enemella dayhoffiae]OYO25210.1 ABC transporter permease [Enemella dayhoffiae]
MSVHQDTSPHQEQDEQHGEAIRTIGRAHPLRWVVTAVVLLIAVALVSTLFTNPRWQWQTVGRFLFDHRILRGVGNTLLLTLIAMTIGIVLGVVLAVMRQSPLRLVQAAAWLYAWFFRGTPVFVQIIFWFNIAALYPDFQLRVPFGPVLWSESANTLITPFVAALLALGLNEGAYMSEVVRGGILAVDRGQSEAAQALGMNRLLTLRRIVLPQALRVILPPTGNQVISMLKITSLVSVIAFTELLYSAQLIYSANFQTIPLLIVASLWYMLFTAVLSVGQYFLERHFGRDQARLGGAGELRKRLLGFGKVA